MTDSETHAGRYPMQWVTRRTGLTPDVIRIWERRYEVVRPERAPNGHRYYSEEDVRKLQCLAALTRSGHRISDIARHDAEGLERLLDRENRPPASPVLAPARPAPEGTGSAAGGAGLGADAALELAFAAIGRADERALRETVEGAAVGLVTLEFLERFVAPLLHRIGSAWSEGELRIGTEHWATAALRTYLGRLLERLNVHDTGPTLIAAAPAGHRHEFGALMAACIGAERGHRVLYLGPDMPGPELARMAADTGARVMALSLVQRSDPEPALQELAELRRTVPEACTLLIGGAAATALPRGDRPPGVVSLPDLSSLATWLTHNP